MSGKKRDAKPRNRAQHGGGASEKRRVQRVLAERRARRNRTLLRIGGAAGVAVLAVVALIVFNNARDSNFTSALVIPTSTPVEVAMDGRSKGDPDAPVKVVEWGDYQCPACAVFTRDIEQLLVADYVATGKVYFEYRDMAFLGNESRAASEAAVCAVEQNSFWDFHRMLYFNQGEHKNDGAFSRSRLNEMAEATGLDMDAFSDCMADDATAAEAESMFNEGRAQGIDVTPSFIINGTLVTGANYGTIRDAIEAALSGR